MPKKHVVKLKAEERERLRQMLRGGRHGARELKHARVLLESDAGQTDAQVARIAAVGISTVERLRRRYCQAGLSAALQDKPQPPRPQKRKIDGEAEAHLIALSCSAAPEGHDHWTLQLLAQRMVELKYLDQAVSDETVRRTLKKTRSSPGSSSSGVSLPSWP